MTWVPLIVAFNALWMVACGASQKASLMMTLNASKGMCIKEGGGDSTLRDYHYVIILFTALLDLGIFKPGQHITLLPLQRVNDWLTMG